MAQYTVKATPRDEKAQERLKAEDQRKDRVLTEVVTTTTLKDLVEGVPKFRRGKKVIKKKTRG